jgi:hypothetical protein
MEHVVGVDCNDCEHVSLTEKEQVDNSRPHICNFYRIRVLHRSVLKPRSALHYRLYPCRQCCEDNYANFKNRPADNQTDTN